jgi:hypothetical protein
MACDNLVDLAGIHCLQLPSLAVADVPGIDSAQTTQDQLEVPSDMGAEDVGSGSARVLVSNSCRPASTENRT